MEKKQTRNYMKNDIFLCEFKGEKFINITSKERINELIQSNKSDEIIDVDEYHASEIKHSFSEVVASLSFDEIKSDDSFDLKKLDGIKTKSINFSNSKIDISIPENIIERIETFFCNGNSEGVIDLSKYKNLVNINILDWNNKITIVDSNKSNKVKTITV